MVPIDGPLEMSLRCSEHGDRATWNGEICCADCERCYQTSDSEKPYYAPDVCECGSDMNLRSRSKRSRAMACCSACYEKSRGEPSPPLRARMQLRSYHADGLTSHSMGDFSFKPQALEALVKALSLSPEAAIELCDLGDPTAPSYVSDARRKQIEAMDAEMRSGVMGSIESQAKKSKEDFEAGQAVVTLDTVSADFIRHVATMLGMSYGEAAIACFNTGAGMVAARCQDPKEFQKLMAMATAASGDLSPGDVEHAKAFLGEDACDSALRALGHGKLADKIRGTVH